MLPRILVSVIFDINDLKYSINILLILNLKNSSLNQAINYIRSYINLNAFVYYTAFPSLPLSLPLHPSLVLSLSLFLSLIAFSLKCLFSLTQSVNIFRCSYIYLSLFSLLPRPFLARLPTQIHTHTHIPDL